MDPDADDDNYQFLEIIERSGNKMLRIITDLLDISQLEAGKLVAKKEMVNITELISLNIETNQLLASKKEIHIDFIKPLEQIYYMADGNKLEQVMNNLLTNAIKFSFPGKKIMVNLERIEGDIQIVVEDQGQGIPQHELQDLFKPFTQTSVKPTHGEQSTGLGLYSVKRIVDAHEGTVTVESTVGTGTRFCVMLPKTV
jgi:signal transduction histidine kinase